MKKVLVVISLSVNFTPVILLSQTDPVIAKETVVMRVIESLVQESLSEPDYTSITENLENAYEDPIDLNSENTDALNALGILSEFQLDQLQQYIQWHGALLSVYEIQLVPGWDPQLIRLILPFIKVGNQNREIKWSIRNGFKRGTHDIIFRYSRIIEEQKGFQPVVDSSSNYYLGSPYQFYFRYRYRFANNLSLGITGKKDRGEEFFKGSQPAGFDFYSGHLFFRNIGRIREIAVGDFQVQFGQGLVFWKGFATRKSAQLNGIRRSVNGIKPYGGTNPFEFLRGAGARLQFGKFSLTMLGSCKFLDASVVPTDSLNAPDPFVQSLYSTGYHRTNSELAVRNQLYEVVGAGRVQYKALKWNVGMSGSFTWYSKSLPEGDRPYQRYDFSGNHSVNAGVDYTFLSGPVYSFGEVAISGNKGYAMLHGFEFHLHPKISVTTVFREYSRNYQALHARAFGERSTNQNERGFYLGYEYHMNRVIKIIGYFDVFQFPWLTYKADRPTWGCESLTQVIIIPGRSTEINLRVNYNLRHENGISNGGLHPLTDIHQTGLRLHLEHTVNSQVALRSRVESTFISNMEQELQWGLIAYQDVIYKPSWYTVDFSCRLAVFRTSGYSTRIYAYENDVLYSFSVPAYYGSGMRFYFNAHVSIGKFLGAWFRIAQTYYANTGFIGSGLDQITGSTRTDVSVQLRLRLANSAKRKRLPSK